MTGRVDAERLAGAWSTARELREQIAATAVSVAETQDWIADTLDHMARLRPHDAERLLARAAHARQFAARERAQAAVYRSGASTVWGPAPADRRPGDLPGLVHPAAVRILVLKVDGTAGGLAYPAGVVPLPRLQGAATAGGRH